jgi:hypothetical protein
MRDYPNALHVYCTEGQDEGAAFTVPPPPKLRAAGDTVVAVAFRKVAIWLLLLAEPV